MNKYLNIVKKRQNKRLSKLNTTYFHLSESINTIRNIEKDDISKGFMKLSRDLQQFITVDSVINYIKFGKPIITYDKLNGLLKTENKKIGIIVFDTETTGLVKKSTEKTFRNQIYEMAAVTYDYSLNETKEGDQVDFFHSKVEDINLNTSNSVTKLSQRIQKDSKFQIKMTEEEINKLISAYDKAAEKDPYNPSMDIFKDNIDDIYKPHAYDIVKMLKIKKLRSMTQADKKNFINLWNNEEYIVKTHNSEAAMITAFFKYIEKQEKKFDQIYMIAHNLSFDKDIVIGAIEDAIKFFQQNNNQNPELLAKNQNLLVKANTVFDAMNSSDTLNGFKSLFNEKKYIEKIELLVKELKIHAYAKKTIAPKEEKVFVSKLLVLLTKIPKTKDQKFRTTSLGKVAPAGINKDWHTAVNDVFVTLQTTKMYFTIPIIISILIKISEEYEKNKNIVYFPSIKIPQSLIKFAIRSKFHHIYKDVKEKIEAQAGDIPHWAANTEMKKTKKENPELVYKYKTENEYKIKDPDFPDETDVEGTLKETPKIKAEKMLEKLAIEKDFVGIDAEIKRAQNNGQMSALQKEMKKMGVDVPVRTLHNIAKEGGFLANDENTLIDKIKNEKNRNLYSDLLGKGFSIMKEYAKAKKIKQGPKYVTDKINKLALKLGRENEKQVEVKQIVEILRDMDLKK
jgi:hypothetical protein